MDDLFRTLVWDIVVKAVLARLFATIPFLAWGPLAPLVELLVTKLAGMVYEVVRQYIVLEAISIRNEAHRKAFETASIKLKILARDKGIDSEEFKLAREANKKALSDFVRFG